jgi:hypothetical protein
MTPISPERSLPLFTLHMPMESWGIHSTAMLPDCPVYYCTLQVLQSAIPQSPIIVRAHPDSRLPESAFSRTTHGPGHSREGMHSGWMVKELRTKVGYKPSVRLHSVRPIIAPSGPLRIRFSNYGAPEEGSYSQPAVPCFTTLQGWTESLKPSSTYYTLSTSGSHCSKSSKPL